jgi:hypothetical protein
VAGFLLAERARHSVIEEIRDWLGFAFGVISIITQFMQPTKSRPHQRTRVSYRRLKFGSFEWTSYDREDDTQS